MKAFGKAEKAFFIAVLSVLAGILGGVFSAPFKKGINVYTERESFQNGKKVRSFLSVKAGRASNRKRKLSELQTGNKGMVEL